MQGGRRRSQLTEHEFVNRRTSERRTELAPAIPREKEEGEANACFCAAEQVNEIQANLLGAAIELATEGAARAEAKFTWIMSSRDGGRQSQQEGLLNLM